MPQDKNIVDASVSKRFFTEIITKDISLEDSILDLIDNSIDSIIRGQNIDIEEAIFNPRKLKRRKFINIEFTPEKFEISDNAGGISREDAENEVFIFGSPQKPERSYLSVYGIGLKRAIFKIGKDIRIISKTKKEGWQIKIDVEEWLNDPKNWTFKIEEFTKAKNTEEEGTTITITNFVDETRRRVKESSFLRKLSREISTVYSVFLGNYVEVFLGQEKIEGIPIPISAPEGGSIQAETYRDSGITVKIAVGIQTQNKKGQWEQALAGWYILCNGRMVVNANKEGLTFWGTSINGGLPAFVAKYRGFIGVVVFLAKDPENLPWSTTKRDLNTDSLAYQRAKSKMVLASKPILRTLNNFYAHEQNKKTLEQEATKAAVKTQLKPLTLKELGLEKTSTFKYEPHQLEEFAYIKIEYEVTKGTFEKAKKLSKQNLSYNELGLFTFKYFLKNES